MRADRRPLAPAQSTDGWSSQLAGCVANFRNTQEPVAVRVELVPPAEGLRDPTLVVLVRTDDTPAAEGGGLAFEPCFAVPQISPLPPGDYFVGLSAWNDKAGGACRSPLPSCPERAC